MHFGSRHLVSRCAFVSLLGATLFAIGCGSSSSTTSPSGSTSTATIVTIFITNGVYSPNPFTMKVGQQVNWKNNDTFAHTATADNGMFNTGSIAPTSAADVPVMMSAAGTINFHCTLHAGETGSIVVQP